MSKVIVNPQHFFEAAGIDLNNKKVQALLESHGNVFSHAAILEFGSPGDDVVFAYHQNYDISRHLSELSLQQAENEGFVRKFSDVNALMQEINKFVADEQAHYGANPEWENHVAQQVSMFKQKALSLTQTAQINTLCLMVDIDSYSCALVLVK